MLYLFGIGSYKNDRKILKVGFTDDMNIRTEQYYIYNPLGEIIETRDGDRILEAKLHIRLDSYKVEFLDEWFYDEPGVKEIFSSDINDIDKWIWDNKSESLLSPNWPKKGTIKNKIFEELKSKFGCGSQIEGTKFI